MREVETQTVGLDQRPGLLDLVAEAIAESGASSMKDMGRVMGTLKQRYPGRMDFGKASALVKERLA